MQKTMRKLTVLALVCGCCAFQSGCSVADAIFSTIGAVFDIVNIWV